MSYEYQVKVNLLCKKGHEPFNPNPNPKILTLTLTPNPKITTLTLTLMRQNRSVTKPPQRWLRWCWTKDNKISKECSFVAHSTPPKSLFLLLQKQTAFIEQPGIYRMKNALAAVVVITVLTMSWCCVSANVILTYAYGDGNCTSTAEIFAVGVGQTGCSHLGAQNTYWQCQP